MKKILLLLLTTQYFSCNQVEKSTEPNKKVIHDSLSDKMKKVKPTLVIKQIPSIKKIFQTLVINDIPGGRISTIFTGSENFQERFSRSPAEVMWINYLDLATRCDDLPYCGKMVLSRIEEHGKWRNFKLYELFFQTNGISISENIRIGSNLDSVKLAYGNPYKINENNNNIFAYYIDSNVIMSIRVNKGNIVSGISLGEYDFINKDTSDFLNKFSDLWEKW